MNSPAREEQQWRITFARFLLCVAILYYLATLVIVALGRRGLHSLRSVSEILVLLLLSAFATVGLTRLRASSILAIAIAALMSLWYLIPTLFNQPLLSAMLRGIGTWRTYVALLVALALNLLPAIAFFVVWPLRPSRAGVPRGG